MMLHKTVEALDQVVIGALGLTLVRLQPVEDGLDAVDGGQDQGDPFGRDRHPLAELADQSLGRVRQRLEPGKPEKAAGSLDRVDQTKNVRENLVVIRLL